MPKYIPETMSPEEIGAFLSQREQGGLARAMAGSVPGTAEFAAANRGKGRLEQLASGLGSAGGGSSSMALGGRVQAGPIYGELSRLTGEALRSIPTAIRRTLTGSKKRRIDIDEYSRLGPAYAEGSTLGHYGAVGEVGQGKSIEQIMVQPDIPSEVKRRVIAHELQHAQQEAGRGPGPLAIPVAQAAPGQGGFLYSKGYPAADIPYEIPAHAVETTMKPRYHLTSGEETVREALVKARRDEAKAIQKAHKERGRQKATTRRELEAEYGRPVHTREKLDLSKATQNEAEVQKALRDYEAARVQSLVK